MGAIIHQPNFNEGMGCDQQETYDTIKGEVTNKLKVNHCEIGEPVHISISLPLPLLAVFLLIELKLHPAKTIFLVFSFIPNILLFHMQRPALQTTAPIQLH